MTCFAGIQNWLCGGESGRVTAVSQTSWSQSPAAERKVPLDVVWEVPPSEQPAKRPDFAVAKYSKIKPLNAALLDSYINGFQRTTTLFFGRIVSNPDDMPAFRDPLGYNMTYNAMASGNGNALHRHNSVEIFVALDAPFELAYGSNGEYKALLQPWDLVSVPAEVIHSYKNMGQDGGQILTFLCGKPAICWADGVVAKARANGAVCDDSGILLSHSAAKTAPALATLADFDIEPPSRQSTAGRSASDASTAASETDFEETLQRRLQLAGMDAPELVLNAGDMDRFVFPYSERSERSLKISSSFGNMAVHWKDLQPGESYAPEGDDDTLLIVLKGSVIHQDRHYTHLDVLKQASFVSAGSEPATLLVARSRLPHNLSFVFDADLMA